MKYLNISLIFLALFMSACSNNTGNKAPSEQNSQTKDIYTCTMHPQVISDHPGACPICGMELVKKVFVAPKEDSTGMAGIVSINSAQAVLANVSTVKVKRENLNKQLQAYSYLDFAEENKKMITRGLTVELRNYSLIKPATLFAKVKNFLRFTARILYRLKMSISLR